MDAHSHHQILKRYYGYDSFRPLQEEIIVHTLNRKDSLVLMPTGGGKSICFQIPALMMDGTAVVVSPLISLMKDQVDTLKANGIVAEAMNSSNDIHTDSDIRSRCKNGELKILYLSPERLVAETNWLRRFVKVSLFAIDEAHCISQWGHDFRPEYTMLGGLHDEFPGVPIMALTATADKVTQNDIVEQLHFYDHEVFISSFDRPNLSLDVRRGYSAKDKLKIILDVIRRHNGESGIIYCLSRKGTEQLTEKLKAAGVSVAVYHAGLSVNERTRVQDDFINDKVNVICATVAFGMGIDKSNIRFIIHNNLPKSIENYYQEIGRGGRDGLETETILFYNIQDMIMLRQFAEESGQREINLEKLKRMQAYAEAQVCRRRILLNYFGENSSHDCGNCDVCKHVPKRFDGTVIVQKALSAIRRTDEQIGFGYTIDILRGLGSDAIRRKGFDQLKTFGVGRDISTNDWHDYLLQMLHLGFVEIAYNDDKHLKVTPLGEDVLYGKTKAELAVIDRQDLRVKKRRNVAEEHVHSFASEDDNLFEKLRELRKIIAVEINMPTYIVMSDKSLRALTEGKPTNKAGFGNTYGIGEHKKEQFGERFVNLICEHLGVLRSPEPTISSISKQPANIIPGNTMSYMDRQKMLHANAYAPWSEQDDRLLTQMYNAGKSIKELAEQFDRNNGAIRARLKKLGVLS